MAITIDGIKLDVLVLKTVAYCDENYIEDISVNRVELMSHDGVKVRLSQSQGVFYLSFRSKKMAYHLNGEKELSFSKRAIVPQTGNDVIVHDNFGNQTYPPVEN